MLLGLSVAFPTASHKIASGEKALVADSLPTSAACSDLADAWPKSAWKSYASSATEACTMWTEDATQGALQAGRTVAESCTIRFAQANCAQTCCTKAGTTPKAVATMATGPEATMMQKIIDAAFENVPDSETRQFPIAEEYQKLTSWTQCSKLPYSPECLVEEESLLCRNADDKTKDAMRTLGLNSCMEGGQHADTATCLSFWAAVKAVSQLVLAFPAGPAFANSLAVGWANGSKAFPIPPIFPAPTLASGVISYGTWGPHPSWLDGGFDADAETMTGTWETLGPTFPAGTSIAAYSLCDMVYNIILNNNNQAGGGTCGPTSVLSSISSLNPKQAFKTAITLEWTGTLPSLPTPPCPYILDSFPGLVQLMDPAKINCKDTSVWSSEQDCNGAMGQPLNAVGLQQVWVQSMLAANIHNITGSCLADNEWLQVKSEQNQKEWWAKITFAQGTVPAQMAWIATNALGLSADAGLKYHIGDAAAVCEGLTFSGDAPPDACSAIASFPGIWGREMSTLTTLATESTVANGGEPNFTQVVEQIMAGNEPLLKAMMVKMAAWTSESQLPTVCLTLMRAVGQAGTGVSTPHTTPEVFATTCTKKHKLLTIAGHVFQQFGPAGVNATKVQAFDTGEYTLAELCQNPDFAASVYGGCGTIYNPQQGACDHWVRIESCPTDEQPKYNIWSWGAAGYLVSPKVLENFICGALHED